jgi:hypothetical protein
LYFLDSLAKSDLYRFFTICSVLELFNYLTALDHFFPFFCIVLSKVKSSKASQPVLFFRGSR